MRLQPFRRIAAAFVAATLLTTAACRDNATDPGPAHTFHVRINGGTQTSLEGDAALVTYPATVVDTTHVPPSAVLVLLDKNGATGVFFEWYGVTAPAGGTYPVGLGLTDVSMRYDLDTNADGSTYDGTSGTITVTSADADEVRGTFAVTATAEDTGAEVTLTGDFAGPIMLEQE
jgi:hypothetical protein